MLEICKESEIGDNETLKVLYAFLATGIVAQGPQGAGPRPGLRARGHRLALVDSFNQMYCYVFKHMVREVGPIAENVLEKYLGTLREARKEVLGGVELLRTARSTGPWSSAT